MSKIQQILALTSPMNHAAQVLSSFQRRFQDTRSQRQVGYYLTYANDTDARNARNLKRWTDEVAWRWLAINPAHALGIENETGSLRAGKRADVVLWNGNPFSVYTRPQQVWVDGALLYDMNNPRMRPVSDFELGQPGEGDVK